MEYAESEFNTFEFVICKFIVVYMNIYQGWANHGPRDYSKAVGKYLEEIHLVTFSIIIQVN